MGGLLRKPALSAFIAFYGPEIAQVHVDAGPGFESHDEFRLLLQFYAKTMYNLGPHRDAIALRDDLTWASARLLEAASQEPMHLPDICRGQVSLGSPEGQPSALVGAFLEHGHHGKYILTEYEVPAGAEERYARLAVVACLQTLINSVDAVEEVVVIAAGLKSMGEDYSRGAESWNSIPGILSTAESGLRHGLHALDERMRRREESTVNADADGIPQAVEPPLDAVIAAYERWSAAQDDWFSEASASGAKEDLSDAIEDAALAAHRSGVEQSVFAGSVLARCPAFEVRELTERAIHVGYSVLLEPESKNAVSAEQNSESSVRRSCRSCGQALGQSFKFCPICGTDASRTADSAVIETDRSAAEAAAGLSDMKREQAAGRTYSAPCPSCGAPIDPSSKFCAKCGAEANRPASQADLHEVFLALDRNQRDIKDLERLVNQHADVINPLHADVRSLEHRLNSSGVFSPSFRQRSLAIWGHAMVPGLLTAMAITVLSAMLSAR